MKKHTQFEEWIWKPDQLSSEQKAALKEHLSICTECQQLQLSWDKFHGSMRSAQELPVSANFINKWNTDLADRKILMKKIQVRRMMLFSLAGVLVSFLAAFGLTLYISSPAELVVSVIKTAINFLSILSQLSSVISNLIRVIPPFIPAIYWLMITSIFSFLSLLWMISFWQISKQGVFKNEK